MIKCIYSECLVLTILWKLLELKCNQGDIGFVDCGNCCSRVSQDTGKLVPYSWGSSGSQSHERGTIEV